MDLIMDFHKYHALGNDYIVIDPNKTKFNVTPKTVRLICNRHTGVGSDGVLFGPLFDSGTVRLRIFNPDGSEAEKSGNGIRIFAKYLIDAGYVKNQRFEIFTEGGLVTVESLNEKANLIKVDMGAVTFVSEKIPAKGPSREVVNEPLDLNGETYQITCLSIGNPHCVIPVERASEELAKKLGPHVETHPLFPNRINMQLLQVLDRNAIRIEIWERGAGYTTASGSSSCAAASAAYKLGLVDQNVTVQMPGGKLDINILDTGHVLMTGSVSGVMQGNFLSDFREKLSKGGVTA